MDIHPPQEPIHTWRDLLTHLGVITVGLFIALSLEGFVEYMHHRHLVAEARANIHQEIQDNHDAAQKDLVLLQQNIDRLKADIATLHKMRADPKSHGSLTNTMNFDSLDDAAWRTARDTGALSYMPYAEVQRYSDLYLLSDLVNTTAISTGHREYLDMAPAMMDDDKDRLPAEEYTNMMRDDAATEIELIALKQYVQQLDDHLLAELKKP